MNGVLTKIMLVDGASPPVEVGYCRVPTVPTGAVEVNGQAREVLGFRWVIKTHRAQGGCPEAMMELFVNPPGRRPPMGAGLVRADATALAALGGMGAKPGG